MVSISRPQRLQFSKTAKVEKPADKKIGGVKKEMTERISKIRQGEIALALVKGRIEDEGIRFMNFKRNLGNISKKTNIPQDELKLFTRILLEEQIEKTFGQKTKRVREQG